MHHLIYDFLLLLHSNLAGIMAGSFYISGISIITKVIIEILAFSLAENGVIFFYNHLRRGDYSGRTNCQNSRLSLRQCV